MNTTEPLFLMKDDSGTVRTVRIVTNHIEGFGGENFRAAVADVVDVVSQEEFKRVGLSRLVPCESDIRAGHKANFD